MLFGNPELERLAILVGLVVIAAMLVLARRPAPLPQVPPAVAPLQHPFDEEFRSMRHWRNNVDQTLPEITKRVVRLEEQGGAVLRQLDVIGHGVQRSERQLELLIEAQLKRAQKDEQE